MRKNFILMILLFAGSCHQDQAPLSEKKLCAVLKDMHIAETYAQINTVDQGGFETKNYDSLFVLYSHIYKRHQLDTATFHKALSWYKQHPDAFDKVYEQILNELSILKEKHKDSVSVYTDSVSVKSDTELKRGRPPIKKN